MTNQFYWQQFLVVDENFSAQNGNVFGSDFIPFQCGEFQNNMEGDVSSVDLTFPIGSLKPGFIDRLIKKARSVSIQAIKGDPAIFSQDFDWQFEGVVIDAAITLQTMVLVIGSPLQPTGNGDAPGKIPFRTLTSKNAGKIPVTRR